MTLRDELEREVAMLRAERAIIRLQTAYGYYVDKGQWDEAADLFAREATLEIAARGQYRGQERIRAYLHELPPLQYGTIFNHMQLQPLITVSDDLLSAKGRWRAIMEVGFVDREELCGEAVYENAYIVEDGVWKSPACMPLSLIMCAGTPAGRRAECPWGPRLRIFPPTLHKPLIMGVFPKSTYHPYHYPNPVTGKVWKEEKPK